MITEDKAFHLWEIKCDECGRIIILYKEDNVETLVDVYNEMLAEGWLITPAYGEHICANCHGIYDR